MELGKLFIFLALCLTFLQGTLAVDSKLGYTGRLVKSNGLPVTGTSNLKFDLYFSGDTSTLLATQTISSVVLVNGVYTVELDFDSLGTINPPYSDLKEIIKATPGGQSLVLQVSDLTNSLTFDFQSVLALPRAYHAKSADISDGVTDGVITIGSLDFSGACSDGEILIKDGNQFDCIAPSSAGEANTISSAGGTSLVVGKVGTDLVLKGLTVSSDLSLSVNATNLQIAVNTSNGNSELVRLAADGKLPALDGSNLTGIVTDNAATLCSAGEYLDGDGTCKTVPSGSSSYTAGTGIDIVTGTISADMGEIESGLATLCSVGEIYSTDGIGNFTCVDPSTLGGDDLGDHIATENIVLGTHYLSGDGGNEGIYIDSSGLVGMGTSSPLDLLHIDDKSGSGSLRGLRIDSTTAHSSVSIFADTDIKHPGIALFDKDTSIEHGNLQLERASPGTFGDQNDLLLKTQTANAIRLATNNTTRLSVLSGGGVQVNSLSGSGTRCLQTDANGNISAASGACTTGGAGETNTASNVGAGTGLFKQKASSDLEFKSLTATSDISLTNNTNDVQIGITSTNSANQLLRLDGSGNLPALNGSALTGIDPYSAGTGIGIAAGVVSANMSEISEGIADLCSNGEVFLVNGSGNFSCVDPATFGDDLGDHTATANVQLNGNWLSHDGDSEGIFISATGDVGIGTSSPSDLLTISGNNKDIHHYSYANNSSYGPDLKFYRAQNNAGAPLVVNNGDFIGSVRGHAYDGDEFLLNSGIYFKADAAGADGIVPSRIELLTQDDSGTNNEVMRIDSSGNMKFGKGGVPDSYESGTNSNYFHFESRGGSAEVIIDQSGSSQGHMATLSFATGSTRTAFVRSRKTTTSGTEGRLEFGTSDGSGAAATMVLSNDGELTVGGSSVGSEVLNIEGRISLKETSAPTSTSNYGKVYVNSGDSRLYFMDDSGTVFDLLNGSGSGNSALNGNWLSHDGDSEGIFVDTDGKVGVGMSNPSQAFEVTGTVKATAGTVWSSNGGTGTTRALLLENYDDTANTNGVDIAAKLGGAEFQGLSWTQDTSWTSGSSAADKDVSLSFGVLKDNVATSAMTLTSDGFLGIGTSGANYPLHIYQATGDAEARIQTAGAVDDAFLTYQNGTYTVSSGLREYLPHATGTEDYGFAVQGAGTIPRLMISEITGNIGRAIRKPNSQFEINGAARASGDQLDSVSEYNLNLSCNNQQGECKSVTGAAGFSTRLPTGVSNSRNLTYHGRNHEFFAPSSATSPVLTLSGSTYTETTNTAVVATGYDATSTNYALKVNNSSSTLLAVRNDGLIGIGSTSPSSSLEIDSGYTHQSGDLTVKSFQPGIQLVDKTSSPSEVNDFRIYNDNGDLKVETDTSNDGTYETSRFYIDRTGIIGIGTNSPGATLEVEKAGASILADAISGNASVQINSLVTERSLLTYKKGGSNRWAIEANSDTESGSDSGSNLSIRSYDDSGAFSGTPLQILRSNGHVGLGTNAPNTVLEVEKVDNGSYLPLLSIVNKGSATGTATGIRFKTAGDSGDRKYKGAIVFENDGSSDGRGTLHFLNDNGGDINNAEISDAKMSILKTGRVGIGTTAPDQMLSVNGDASKTGGGSWATFSDRRLKDITGEFHRSLKDMRELEVITYRYKEDNEAGIADSKSEHVGFIAQEVQKVIPESVMETSSGYLQVNNDPILWTMFNSIKELDLIFGKEAQRNEMLFSTMQREVQENSRRIASLEEENNELKNQVKAQQDKIEDLNKRLKKIEEFLSTKDL